MRGPELPNADMPSEPVNCGSIAIEESKLIQILLVTHWLPGLGNFRVWASSDQLFGSKAEPAGLFSDTGKVVVR